LTTQQQLDKLTKIAADALESIRGLELIASQHQALIEKHDAQIENILTGMDTLRSLHDRTDTSIRAMADELINTQREWQAYLRRIPRQ